MQHTKKNICWRGVHKPQRAEWTCQGIIGRPKVFSDSWPYLRSDHSILYCCPLFSSFRTRGVQRKCGTRRQNRKWLLLLTPPPICWPPPPLLCPEYYLSGRNIPFRVPHGRARYDHHKRGWSIDTEINHVHKYAFDVWLHRRAKTKANKMEIRDRDWGEKPLFIASRFLSGNDEVRIASLTQTHFSTQGRMFLFPIQ